MDKTFLVLAIFLTGIFSISAVLAATTFFDQDDAFIMGNSPTGEVSGGTSGETAGGGGCRYEWSCTNWSECLPYGNQTRICTNKGACPDNYGPPKMEQNCISTASEIRENNLDNKTVERPFLSLKEKKVAPNEKSILRVFLYVLIILLILLSIFSLQKNYCRTTRKL